MYLLRRMAFTVALVSATPPILAQSLVDVARQEEARRSAVGKPSKVFTNATLSPVTDQAADATQKQPPAPAAAGLPASGNSTPATTAPKAKPAAGPADEKRWRGQAAALWARIATARKELDALAGASHADPREQALLDAIRTRRRAALGQAEEALRLFEMQADAAGVPNAWLLEPR